MYLPQDDSDAVLVARTLEGDTGAFETLVTRCQGPLFGVAYRILGSREDARDVTQNALIKAFRKLDTFDTQYRFFTWVYRILVNECLNEIRSRPPVDQGLVETPSASGDPFDALAQRERRGRIRAALAALVPDQRDVVILRHFEGLSYDEIAEATGVPAKTVKSRLYSARQRLGELLLAWNKTR